MNIKLVNEKKRKDFRKRLISERFRFKWLKTCVFFKHFIYFFGFNGYYYKNSIFLKMQYEELYPFINVEKDELDQLIELTTLKYPSISLFRAKLTIEILEDINNINEDSYFTEVINDLKSFFNFKFSQIYESPILNKETKFFVPFDSLEFDEINKSIKRFKEIY